jgi:hypothetical protein
MTSPVTPNEVKHLAAAIFPQEVIEAFNYEIVKHYVNGSAKVLQRDVVESLVKSGFAKYDIFKNGWLNVEEIYRGAGWDVEYDRPGYDESYDAFFLFKKAK